MERAHIGITCDKDCHCWLLILERHTPRARSLRGADGAHWDAVIGAPVTAGARYSYRPRVNLS